MDTIRIKKEYNRDVYVVSLTLYGFTEGGAYILYCPSLDLYAYGYSKDEAFKSFDEVADLFFEDLISTGNNLVKELKRLGWDIKSQKQNKTTSPSEEKLKEMRPEFLGVISHGATKSVQTRSFAA